MECFNVFELTDIPHVPRSYALSPLTKGITL
jgi:hypothetical protein